MAPDKSIYFARYYRDHRPSILAKRRLRYRNDPEYREKMQEKARDRARLKAEERRKQQVSNTQQRADDLKNHSIDFEALGAQKLKHWPVGDFVTASVVAEALGVSRETLGNWIRGNMIPPPTISSTAGKHLFSIDYLSLVRDCRIESLAKGFANGEFGEFVLSRYESIRETEESMRNGGLDE